MNELFDVKHDELLTEFHLYVMEHPEFLLDIPNEALIVLLDRNDPAFNRYNLQRTEAYLHRDDVSDRPVVYLDVGELAPPHSRLVNPRLLTMPEQLLAEEERHDLMGV